MTALWEKTRAIEIKMLVHCHLHPASIPGVLPKFFWVSHCFLLWVPGNASPLGISYSTGNPLESQGYLSIPPLSLIEKCLGAGHWPQALPFQRWKQSHRRLWANGSPLQATTVRLGMKRQEIYGGFEVVNMRLELNSTFTIDKSTFISQLSFNTYDTLISYLL